MDSTEQQHSTEHNLTGPLVKIRQNYAQGNPRPLGGYLVTLAGYGVYMGTLAVTMYRSRGHISTPLPGTDLLLAGIATHKLSRMLAKDPITSPLRAPVTRFEEPAGEAELHESVRGHGVAHAAGELVTCPFCLATWVSTTLISGFVLLPNSTRIACTVLTTSAISDTLQLAYSWLKTRVT